MFHRAQRKKAKLRLAACGPSGSGKTMSALLVAMGIGGSIAMIDTENGSGELYAHVTEYDVCTITPPYTPEKYVQAIHAAEAAGYNVIIIDSLTHAWAGRGGLLEEVDKRKTGANHFSAWRDVTPMHNNLVEAMLQSSAHIIATMRTKTAYDMVKNEKGKVVPVKVGLAPVQRDGMEYEFTVVLDLDVDKHTASASKDRTGLFDGKVFIPSEDTGKELLKWLETGVDPNELQFKQAMEAIDECQTVTALKKLWSEKAKGWERNTHFSEIYEHVSNRTNELAPPPPPEDDPLSTEAVQ